MPALDIQDLTELENAGSTPVIIYFWSPSCGYCVRFKPVMDQWGVDLEGRVKVLKVNILEDAGYDIASQFGVRSVPQLLFFRDGQKMDQLIGPQTRGTMKQMIASLLGEGPIIGESKFLSLFS